MEEKKFMFCTNCGNKYEKDQKFCTNCGQPIAPVEQSNNDGKDGIKKFEKSYKKIVKDAWVLLVYIILISWIYLLSEATVGYQFILLLFETKLSSSKANIASIFSSLIKGESQGKTSA